MLRIFFMKRNKIKNCPDNLNIYTTSHQKSDIYRTPIPEKYYLGKKEGWGNSSMNKLKNAQQAYSIRRFTFLEISSRGRRFSLQD